MNHMLSIVSDKSSYMWAAKGALVLILVDILNVNMNDMSKVPLYLPSYVWITPPWINVHRSSTRGGGVYSPYFLKKTHTHHHEMSKLGFLIIECMAGFSNSGGAPPNFTN